MTDATPLTVLGPFTRQCYAAAWVAFPRSEPNERDGIVAGPDGSPGCWTYRDQAGYGPSLALAGDRHPTAERALEAAVAGDILLAAQGKPFETRAAYEAAVSRLGLSLTWPDADCVHMAQADWDPATYGIQGAALRTLATRRGLHLREEQEAARRLSAAEDHARLQAALRAADLEERAGGRGGPR